MSKEHYTTRSGEKKHFGEQRWKAGCLLILGLNITTFGIYWFINANPNETVPTDMVEVEDMPADPHITFAIVTFFGLASICESIKIAWELRKGRHDNYKNSLQ